MLEKTSFFLVVFFAIYVCIYILGGRALFIANCLKVAKMACQKFSYKRPIRSAAPSNMMHWLPLSACSLTHRIFRLDKTLEGLTSRAYKASHMQCRGGVQEMSRGPLQGLFWGAGPLGVVLWSPFLLFGSTKALQYSCKLIAFQVEGRDRIITRL